MISKALERQGGEDTLLDYLQKKIADSLARLYNYWLDWGNGLPSVHSSANNFFIFEGGTDPNKSSID